MVTWQIGNKQAAFADREIDVQHSSRLRDFGERGPGGLNNQLFDAVQDGIREAGKRPAVGGGGMQQLGGHEERWAGGRRGGVGGGEEEELGGYLSNLWVGRQRGVGSEQIYQEGKKAGSTGVKHTEAPLRGLPLV